MPTIAEQREQLVAHAAHFEKTHADEKGLLSAEDQRTFDAMLAAVKAMGQPPAARQQLIHAPAKGERLVDDQGRIRRTLSRDESFTEAVLENAELFGVTAEQQKYAADMSIGDYLASMIVGPRTAAEKFALSESSPTGGGYTAPPYLAAQIIDLFRRQLVMQRAGAVTLPLHGPYHRFARMVGKSSPAWRREGVQVTESGPTFGALELQPRSLAVLVKATRELLQDSPNMGTIIEECIAADVAEEVDRVAIFGDGVQEPQGLYGLQFAGINEVTSIGALTDYSDFIDARRELMDDNVPNPTATIISNREWSTLAKLTAEDQPMIVPPAIADVPFIPSSMIPTTLGGGGESFALMGYFPDVVLGYRLDLTISRLDQLYAETGEIGFIAFLRMDTGLFRAPSLCRMLGITT